MFPFDTKSKEPMVRLEILVSERVAAEVEALETSYLHWKQAKDEVAKKRALDTAIKAAQRSEQAMLIHCMRPPEVFMPQIESVN